MSLRRAISATLTADSQVLLAVSSHTIAASGTPISRRMSDITTASRGRKFALAAGRYEEIGQSPTVQLARMPRPGLQRRARSPSWQYLCPENHGDPGSGHCAVRHRSRSATHVHPQKLAQRPEDTSPNRTLQRRASRLASSRSPGELTFISRRSGSPKRRNSSPTYSTPSAPSRNPCTARAPPSSAVPIRGSSVLA